MSYATLVDTHILARHLDDPAWVIVDCRFVLTDPGAGRRAYDAGHIMGARYAHLDHDLSSPVTASSGRHPLPYPGVLAEKLGRWGIDKTKQVVVYDDSLGAIAARLWWLLRWLGHEAVALLDVGYPKWLHEKLPVETREPDVEPAQFHPTVDNLLWVDTSTVEQLLRDGGAVLMDARSEERFAGDVEPLDRIPGHVPGAVNMPYEDNLAYDSSFLSPAELKDVYLPLMHDTAADKVVQMCGSGVTACHNLLAMEHAGLKGARLYAGSWSEWIRDDRRPVARGSH